jgi:hypothetical protein
MVRGRERQSERKGDIKERERKRERRVSDFWLSVAAL